LIDLRPDLADEVLAYLDVDAAELSPLAGLSIGEIGVVYEALLALSDHLGRRESGQFFTPDDVAHFMAVESARFTDGIWLDPCCGIGNLSFHLARAARDPEGFVSERLVLVDRDPTALKTAVSIMAASFGGRDALTKLSARSEVRDFLSSKPLPHHDYAILNPPYARAEKLAGFETGESAELYAYFLEKVIKTSAGFIAITPASHLGGAKYASLRRLLQTRPGGTVLVFDNVPDTCFRGYKYGSTNTSKTNFVRAAITTSAPGDRQWQVSPILRWAARSRQRMWSRAREMVVPLRTGPAGEWAKVMPGTESVWDALADGSTRLGDLVVKQKTVHRLNVASTPRYYISASKRQLDRGSQHVLFFRSKEEMDTAYLLLNSSVPYWWWRCLDGGITLPLRTLLSTPVPASMRVDPAITTMLESSEETQVVTKLNAGRQNENVRRPRELVASLDKLVLTDVDFDFELVFAPDMFSE